MFKQVHSGWPKAIRSIRNSVNMGPTKISEYSNYSILKLDVLSHVLTNQRVLFQSGVATLLVT